jgi:hypothetical protein
MEFDPSELEPLRDRLIEEALDDDAMLVQKAIVELRSLKNAVRKEQLINSELREKK